MVRYSLERFPIMLLNKLIPDFTGRMVSMADSSLRALVASNGDGTTFKQDRSRQVWDIVPANNMISNLTVIACKGHYHLLTSARQCEEIATSPFRVVPIIDFQGNDETVTILKGQRFEAVSIPNWSAIHTVMENKLGGFPNIRNTPIEHFYGSQMSESHECYQEAEDLLSSLVPRIDLSCRLFKAIAIPEGHCIMPVETPGKHKGYLTFVGRLPHKIGLHTSCRNDRNDRDMLTVVGNLENDIAFWVSTAKMKPPRANVFVIPNEDALFAILDELSELLPNRNK